MVWAPTVSDAIVNVALPELKLAVASVVAPSRKVTVPVGVPEPGETALTVAVKVTDCPKTDAFTDEVTPVVLESLVTDCVSAADVLFVKLLSPA
jgi:hypothetical protein